MTESELIDRAEEINRIAAKGEPFETSQNLAEHLLYLSLRQLYFLYKQEQITKPDAAKHKNRLVQEFLNESFKFELFQVQAERHKVFTKYSQDIKNNGCKVCQKLSMVICGLED